MGNANKKKKKEENKSSGSQKNEENKEKEEKNVIKIIKEKRDKNTKIGLKLINMQTHSNEKDKIEEAFTIQDFPDTLIIGCRSGDIKKISKVTSSHDCKDKSNILVLYKLSKRLYSLILIDKNNKLCAGLESQLVILKINLNEKNSIQKENELSVKGEGPIYSLLELKNENLISAGKNIILWKKMSSSEYNQIKSISAGYYKIINLVEFPYVNTILATQENTHLIYVLKNEENSIDLICKKEDVSSIWYKGSAQHLTGSAMLLVGKFELNAIDAKNGVVISRYPGIDKGSLLKMHLKDFTNDVWIVSHYMGTYFEFYEQEESDLLFYDKIELDEDEIYGWGHKLIKINDECFATVNHYGQIHVYKINKNK